MKRNKKKLLLTALCAALCCSAAFGACGKNNDKPNGDNGGSGDNGNQEQPVSVRPKITVDTAELSGRLAEEAVLPKASATDDLDGDLTDKISVSVYFARDTLTVYESTGGAAEHKFTPTKVGEYTVIYKVSNSRNKNARQEIVMNVADNPGAAELAPQLVADKENWTFTSGNKFDEEDYLRVKAEFGTSAAYGGRKILSGDTVSFRFSANPGKEMFYSVNACMSSSYNLDEPIKKESNNGFPLRLALRVSASSIEAYIGSYNNNNFPFDRINKKVLDGKDHTMSLRSTLNGDSITFEVWVDADPMATSTYHKTITKAEMQEHYGTDFDEQFADMFDAEKFGGWFNIGSYDGDGKGYLTLKALAINGEQHINEPDLKVDENLEPTYLVNEEITFPAATAEDKNTYSDLTSRIKATLVTPSGESVDLETLKYTPAETGRYVLTYLVSDYSGNKAKKSFEFSVSTVINTVAPTIAFAEDVPATLQGNAGEAVALPVPESVTDEQGTDLSSRVKIELIGSEYADLTGKTSVTAYAPGKHTIRYSVTDDCALTAVREFTFTVNTLYSAEKNLADKTTYRSTSSSIYTENGITAKSTGKVAGQKVYDEKISIKLKGDLLGSFVYINIRGGKNLDEPDNLNLDWNTGLIVKLSCALGANGNATIAYGGHDQNGQDLTIPSGLGKNLAELMSEGLTLSVLATDITDEDGTVTDVTVKMWINDVLVTTESGCVFDTAFIKKNPGILKAGWLTISGYEYGTGADLSKVYIEDIRIGTASAAAEEQDIIVADGKRSIASDEEN